MCIGLQVKYPLFLSDSNETRVSSTYFRKIFKYQNSMKFRPVGPKVFHAEEQMDGQRERERETNRQKDRNNEANKRFS